MSERMCSFRVFIRACVTAREEGGLTWDQDKLNGRMCSFRVFRACVTAREEGG